VQLISAVGAPIVAFLLRLVIGNQRFLHFDHFRWQRYVFWVAIIFLVFVDALLILFGSTPQVVKRDDWLIWFGMYGVYLVTLSVALFPFRRRSARDVFWKDQYSPTLSELSEAPDGETWS
jgi:hypothetical protein